MNNRFSDIDKVIITTWLFLGAGVGVFAASIFHASYPVAGAIGFFAGALVDYLLFFKPRREENTSLISVDPQVNSMADEETDIAEFIRDSFEAGDIIPQDEIEFRYEGNIGEENSEGIELEENPEIIVEGGDETDSSPDHEESIEETNNEIEIKDATEEDMELEDENIDEENLEEQSPLPASRGYGSQIHSSSYDQYEGDKPRGTQPWLTPTQFPMALAFLWFFISQLTLDNSSELTKSISAYFPPFLFVIVPICFLIGLSGLIGLLFGKQNEDLEMSSKENAVYLINLLKLFAGWGVGIYVILVNLE